MRVTETCSRQLGSDLAVIIKIYYNEIESDLVLISAFPTTWIGSLGYSESFIKSNFVIMEVNKKKKQSKETLKRTTLKTEARS